MSWVYSDQWAAGFFDGEGSVSINRRNSRTPQHDLSVQVSQKQRPPLDELYIQHGGTIGQTKTPAGCWRWRLAGRKAEEFLIRIRPYVLVKRDVIDIAIDFRKTVVGTGKRLPFGVTNQREIFRKQIIEKNRS